jgi:hypothetical protein
MKEPRVKDIILHYKNGNLLSVYNYLNDEDINVDSSTWAGSLKRNIENKEFETAKNKIELIAYKFLKL